MRLRTFEVGPGTSWGVALAVLWVAGCDCEGPHDPLGPCSRIEPPPTCGESCGGEDQEPCPLGFYCSTQGACTQDCSPLSPEADCPGGTCTEDGHCIGREIMDDAGERDANTFCADVRVQARRVTPNVILIVDQSGSMSQGFGGSSRWDALRDSLLSRPDGFVADLESSVRFGLAMYSARAGDGAATGMCPLIEWVPPALDNYDAIAAVYEPADPIDETPTGQSVDAVIDRLNATPDPSMDPTIFILATDGEPDTCEQPNPQDGQPQVIAAVERAFGMGIRTFVISVGRDVSEEHLQDVANAGIGAGSGAPFWVAGDDEGLRRALSEIIGGQLSCTVNLSGRIEDVGEACTGRVELNGDVLPCDDPDGWRAVDETTIELQGEACERLQSTPGVTLEATFPCDVVLI